MMRRMSTVVTLYMKKVECKEEIECTTAYLTSFL